jgi:hypothetical protein
MLKLLYDHHAKTASRVISQFRSFETGQLAFASAAAAANCSALIPGTTAFVESDDVVMVPSVRVISQRVSMLSAVNPAAFNTKLNYYNPLITISARSDL